MLHTDLSERNLAINNQRSTLIKTKAPNSNLIHEFYRLLTRKVVQLLSMKFLEIFVV